MRGLQLQRESSAILDCQCSLFVSCSVSVAVARCRCHCVRVSLCVRVLRCVDVVRAKSSRSLPHTDAGSPRAPARSANTRSRSSKHAAAEHHRSTTLSHNQPAAQRAAGGSPRLSAECAEQHHPPHAHPTLARWCACGCDCKQIQRPRPPRPSGVASRRCCWRHRRPCRRCSSRWRWNLQWNFIVNGLLS